MVRMPRSIVDKFNNEEAESMNTLTSERARELGYLGLRSEVLRQAGREHAQQPEPAPTPEQTTTQRNNESLRKLQDIIDSLSRGDKTEINEGEYLQLSQSLMGFFVS
jgi:hypothetical protein